MPTATEVQVCWPTLSRKRRSTGKVEHLLPQHRERRVVVDYCSNVADPYITSSPPARFVLLQQPKYSKQQNVLFEYQIECLLSRSNRVSLYTWPRRPSTAMIPTKPRASLKTIAGSELTLVPVRVPAQSCGRNLLIIAFFLWAENLSICFGLCSFSIGTKLRKLLHLLLVSMKIRIGNGPGCWL